MDLKMKFFFTAMLLMAILAIASSVMNNPIIIVRAINTPLKVKPTEEWTIKVPYWEQREFCIYQPEGCQDHAPLKHLDMLVEDVT
jgi:hypothetical protein